MIVHKKTLTSRGMSRQALNRLLEHGHLIELGAGRVATNKAPCKWHDRCYIEWKAADMPHANVKGEYDGLRQRRLHQ